MEETKFTDTLAELEKEKCHKCNKLVFTSEEIQNAVESERKANKLKYYSLVVSTWRQLQVLFLRGKVQKEYRSHLPGYNGGWHCLRFDCDCSELVRIYVSRIPRLSSS
jgi:hypothetical protein